MFSKLNSADSHSMAFLMSSTTLLKNPATAVTASSRSVMTRLYSASAVWMTVVTASPANFHAILTTFSAPWMTLFLKCSMSVHAEPSSPASTGGSKAGREGS